MYTFNIVSHQVLKTCIFVGWCKFYEFSDGDLRAGLEVLDTLDVGTNNNTKWEFVHGLYANAIYGGRVDDVHDIKILNSYLTRVFNPEVISGSGRVNKPLGPFELPASYDMAAFSELIGRLPDEDKPSLFGLPANIERSRQRVESAATVANLRTLMRTSAGAAKFEREKWQKELTPVLGLWKKLNTGSNLLQTRLSPPTSGDGDPIKAFVELEFFNAVSLLQAIHRELSALSKVIRGTALLDEKVAKLADSLLKQQTPYGWQKLWDGPEDPMEYIKTVCVKAAEVQKWASKRIVGNDEELDLSDLFHPETFLGALRQRTAREFGVAMDELELANSWSRGGGTISGAKLPIRVGGLMLEGAQFDGVRLSASSHDAPTVTMAPVCTVAWIPTAKKQNPVGKDIIKLPLYYSSEREKIVADLELPSGGDHDKWLQAGAVLFINSHMN